MSPTPLVSFCIPTFNRSRYLESLLGSLEEPLAAFPYPYEIVIADNASTDRTPAVIEAFAARLPIRAIRHAENIGGFANFQFVTGEAAGRYMVYIADDDSLMVEHVASTIARMEADPGIAVVYAPQVTLDLVADKDYGTFYNVPRDFRVAQGEHRELLDVILRHHVFPEVQITRTDVMRRVMPRINEQAFFAFVHAADYLAHGAVLVQQQPFYVQITNYFADDVREQLGNQEVEYAWDRYRGGLDYLLARAGDVPLEERLGLQLRIQQMIATRMSVALRLRIGAGRNPVDTHMIAMRLRGMGYEAALPVPMPRLSLEAALHFLLNDPVLARGTDTVLCAGPCEPELKAYLEARSPRPVRFEPHLPPRDSLSRTLVFLRAATGGSAYHDKDRGVRVVAEAELMARFPQ